MIDRLGLGAPTDFGISYKGNLISDLNFNLAVVNGTGIKAENDKKKKFFWLSNINLVIIFRWNFTTIMKMLQMINRG